MALLLYSMLEYSSYYLPTRATCNPDMFQVILVAAKQLLLKTLCTLRLALFRATKRLLSDFRYFFRVGFLVVLARVWIVSAYYKLIFPVSDCHGVSRRVSACDTWM